MTKKDYELIARALASSKPKSWIQLADEGKDWTYTYELEEQWSEIRDALADAFAQDNPHFDREKFLTACEVVEPPYETVGTFRSRLVDTSPCPICEAKVFHKLGCTLGQR